MRIIVAPKIVMIVTGVISKLEKIAADENADAIKFWQFLLQHCCV